MFPGGLKIVDAALNDEAMALLKNRCAGCHGTTSGGFGGFNSVENLTYMVQKGYVVPGSPTTSRVYLRSTDGTMPPGSPLTATETDVLLRWIRDGLSLTGPSSTDPPPDTLPFTFADGTSDNAKAAITLLYKKCAACHNSTSGDSLGGHLLNVWDPQQIQIAGLAEPGHASRSPLYTALTGGRMPKAPYTALTSADIAIVRSWIDSELTTSTPSVVGYTPEPLTSHFSSIQRQILAPRCALCHGGSKGTKGGKNYTTYTYTKKTVKPNLPADSSFYTICQSGEMPQTYRHLTSTELAAISGWINAGAPND